MPSFSRTDPVCPQNNQSCSRQDVLDHLAGDVGQAVVASLVLEGQPLVVDAQERQDGGVEVVDVDRVGDDVVAELSVSP